MHADLMSGNLCTQAAFSGCQELDLTNATMTADCAQHLVAGHSLARIKVRSGCFKPTSSSSAFEDLQAFTETLQVCFGGIEPCRYSVSHSTSATTIPRHLLGWRCMRSHKPQK